MVSISQFWRSLDVIRATACAAWKGRQTSVYTCADVDVCTGVSLVLGLPV